MMTPSDPAGQPAAGLGPLELFALLHPNSPGAGALAQLALAPLVAAGSIAVERTPRPKRRWGTPPDDVRLVLTGRPAPKGPSGAYAAALAALAAKPVAAPGLTPLEAAMRLQKGVGYAYERLLHDHARPCLVARGLLERHERKVLGLFCAVRFARTPSGDTAHAALAAWVRQADRLPVIRKEGLPAAVTFASTLGVAVLLSDVARPHLPALAQEARRMGLTNPTAAPRLEGRNDDPGGWAFMDAGSFSDAGSLGDAWDTLGALGDLGGFDGSDGGGGDGGGGGD